MIRPEETVAVGGIGRLSAREQLAVRKDYPGLVPGLCARGLGLEDAAAVAYNAVLLFYCLETEPRLASPEDVLARFSLEEMAELCGDAHAVQEGTLEIG